jgi:hypothetical protein
MPDRVIEELDEDTCLQLISPGGVGRIAYAGRFGLVVLPVNYALHDGAVVFRTAEHGPLDEDLRTGIDGAEYKVAFEIDDIDLASRQGWSVLIQGPASHVSGAERDTTMQADVRPLAPGARELFVRIVPSRVTGRRISPALRVAGWDHHDRAVRVLGDLAGHRPQQLADAAAGAVGADDQHLRTGRCVDQFLSRQATDRAQGDSRRPPVTESF